MKNKGETINLLFAFVTLIQNQFNKRIKFMRTDNQQEFNLEEFYDKLDIIRYTTCIETLQQNFVVERKHQHMLNVSRCLMH